MAVVIIGISRHHPNLFGSMHTPVFGPRTAGLMAWADSLLTVANAREGLRVIAVRPKRRIVAQDEMQGTMRLWLGWV